LAAVCDHAAPDVHSETALAKINPAAMRILFPLQLIPLDVCLCLSRFRPLVMIA
jgi:hypothetical protein